MVASTGTPPAAQPPPDLPSMPDVSSTLSDYLRRFSLWCRNGFADKVSATAAISRIYMLSPLGYVFKLSISDQGQLLSTPIAYGTGVEGTPVLAFAPVGAFVSVSSGSPVGTTSSAYRMMGLGSTLVLTPSVSTQVDIIADGQLMNSVAVGETHVAICYGTGVPPVNGAAQVGTLIMPVVKFVSETAGEIAPFSMNRRATSLILTPPTPYWFDLAVLSLGGGTGATQNVHMTVREVS